MIFMATGKGFRTTWRLRTQLGIWRRRAWFASMRYARGEEGNPMSDTRLISLMAVEELPNQLQRSIRVLLSVVDGQLVKVALEQEGPPDGGRGAVSFKARRCRSVPCRERAAAGIAACGWERQAQRTRTFSDRRTTHSGSTIRNGSYERERSRQIENGGPARR